MPADVNVTEKVARAIHAAVVADLAGRGEDPSEAADWIEWLGEADAALTALADPDVLAGIAGVLREHRMAWSTYTRRVVCRGCDFMAMGVLEQEEARQIEERHQADAVGEWLRGRAL